MRQVYLGSTDLKGSDIAFGTWAFGGDWGAVDVEESTAVIHRALELGITLFDTAQGLRLRRRRAAARGRAPATGQARERRHRHQGRPADGARHPAP